MKKERIYIINGIVILATSRFQAIKLNKKFERITHMSNPNT